MLNRRLLVDLAQRRRRPSLVEGPVDPGPGVGGVGTGTLGFTRVSKTSTLQGRNLLIAFALPPLRDSARITGARLLCGGGSSTQVAKLALYGNSEAGSIDLPNALIATSGELSVSAGASEAERAFPWTMLPVSGQRLWATLWLGNAAAADAGMIIPLEYRVGNQVRKSLTYSTAGSFPSAFGTPSSVTASVPQLYLTYESDLSGAAGAGRVTLLPTKVALTTQVPNPFAGPHKWLNNSSYVASQQNVFVYNRFTWNQLESSQGNYDFSVITAEKNAAEADGLKFAFRVRSERAPGDWYVPNYLSSYTGSGFYNNSFVQGRWQALLNALAAVFDGQIAFIEAGPGQYGEFAGSNWNPTSATRSFFVNAPLVAFQNTTFVIHTADELALQEAFAITPKERIGFRNDIWNRPSAANQSYAVLPQSLRYQIERAGQDGRLIIGEPSPQTTSDVSPLCFLNQMKFFNVHSVGNGNWNIGSFSSLSTQEQADLTEAYRRMGYRFEVDRVDGPNPVVNGVSQTWHVWMHNRNVGWAPKIGTWTVEARLRNVGSGAISSALSLPIDPRTIYPTQVNAIQFSFNLSWTGIGSGSHRVDIRIRNTVLGNIALGSGTSQGSGWYEQGTVTVA